VKGQEDSDAVARSHLVDQVAAAVQDGIRRYVAGRGRGQAPPDWEHLDQAGRNQLRAAVVAIATRHRPVLEQLLEAIR
jgi:hypothetical protein